MPTFTIVLLIITAIVVGITIALYFVGKKQEKKKAEQDAMMEESAQNVSMLIIDKKKMKLKDSGLPEAAIAQTPFYAKGAKMPVIKAKVGPKIMTFLCDPAIFNEIPTKKEVKARVAGLYIISVKGLHGKNETKEEPKKGFRAWMNRRAKSLNQN